MRSNCVLFALTLYWRRKQHAEPRRLAIDGERYFVLWRSGDGKRHILLRTSRLGSWLPHMLYAERRGGQVRVVHFVPRHAKPKAIPPPLFSGRSRWGDKR